MVELIELITELQQTEKYNRYLLCRVEEELGRLCGYIRPDSQTAQAFRTDTWKEIAKAARKDSRIYDAGVYIAIAVLAFAAQKALWRWNDNRRSQRVIYGSAALKPRRL